MHSFFSKEKLDSAKNVLEIIKYIVEILAIIIAGLWVYAKYIEMDKPLLSARTSSISDLEWYHIPKSDGCMARVGMTIKNIGSMPFSVDKVVVQAWEIEPNFNKQGFKLFAPKNEKKTLLDERQYDRNNRTSLIGRYAANEENQIDFNYQFQTNVTDIALFVIKAKGPDVDVEESRWGFVCDIKK